MRSYITIKSDLESVLLEKKKGINQTELANLLGKSLRTIQKYESGEIEVSIAMLNEIAKVLDCESTYLIGYDVERKPLENLSDIMNFLFQLDKIKELGFILKSQMPARDIMMDGNVLLLLTAKMFLRT